MLLCSVLCSFKLSRHSFVLRTILSPEGHSLYHLRQRLCPLSPVASLFSFILIILAGTFTLQSVEEQNSSIRVKHFLLTSLWPACLNDALMIKINNFTLTREYKQWDTSDKHYWDQWGNRKETILYYRSCILPCFFSLQQFLICEKSHWHLMRTISFLVQ